MKDKLQMLAYNIGAVLIGLVISGCMLLFMKVDPLACLLPPILEPMPKLVSYVLKYSLTKVIKERLLMLIRKVLQPVSTV